MLKSLCVASMIVLLASLQPKDVAPSALLSVAGVHPFAFVELLAEAAVPAGLEIGQSDRWPPTRLPAPAASSGSTTPIMELATAFNRHHTTYSAEVLDGVLVIRPRDRKAEYLEASALPGRLSATGLMPAAEKIFAPLDPRLFQEAGRAGSVLGPVGIDIDRGERVHVTVDGTGRRNIDVLNDIARQAPGHPWFVVTDGEAARIVRFGFIHRHGTTTEYPIR